VNLKLTPRSRATGNYGLKFKKSKVTIVIFTLISVGLIGLSIFIFNRQNSAPQDAKANSLALPSIYQVNLNPTNLTTGQVYDLNTSNIKFRSTSPYYAINVDYVFNSPNTRRVYAKLKGLNSNSYYPISSLCINDLFTQEKLSGSGSFSGSGVFSGSGLFRAGNSLNTDKVSIGIPYFWDSNARPENRDLCRTSNTNFSAPEFQFTNYNYKAFSLPNNFSAVVTITELPSEQIDSSEIMYFITSLPQKASIYLSGTAESDYLNANGGSYNFRFNNPSEAGKPFTPNACQQSTYFYLNVNAIDCFTQKDLENGKVKIKVSDTAASGFDQIKLVAFDKFHTKAFDYNFNVTNPNTSNGGTKITFGNSQTNNQNNNTPPQSNNNQPTNTNQNNTAPNSNQNPNKENQSKPVEVKIKPEDLPKAFKSKSQSSNKELILDAVFGIKKSVVKGITNFNFKVSKINKIDSKRNDSDFTCKLFADNIYRGDKNKSTELVSNTMDQGNCAITFKKDKTKKYNKSAKFYIKITDSQSGHIYTTNKLNVSI